MPMQSINLETDKAEYEQLSLKADKKKLLRKNSKDTLLIY